MKKFTPQTYIDPNFLLPETVFRATVSEVLEIAEEELNKNSKDLVVLDIGSGKGEHTIELAKRVKKAIGVEPYKISFNIAQHLKTKFKSKAFFYNTHVEDYKTTKRFDLVICLATIEHMPDAKASFENIFKILNEGGLIYMTAPNKLWPIEPHYNLPFLNYLPLPLANIYLQITGKGKSFKDSSYGKTYFGMKKFLNQFPCTYYFYLPDPNSPYLGEKGSLYKILYKLGIFLISKLPIFWAISKGFIIIIKKNSIRGGKLRNEITLMKKNNSKAFNKSKFEEDYFEGYYKGIADFTDKRDKELANWFRGMFEYINHYYPIKKGKGKKLIEFGCATGAASSVLRSFGWDVTATDISKYALGKAKKNFESIKFLVHDMERPFNKEKFNMAAAFDVIEHLKDPKEGITNVYNLLKKDGTAIFSTPNDYPHVSNDPTHISVKAPYEWEKILKIVGFKNIFMKQITLIPYFYRWHWRLALALPFATESPYFISPVIIIARK